MRTQAQIDAVIQDIRSRLDARREANGMALHVPPGGYEQHEDWLSVIVRPDQQGAVRAYDYVEALHEIDREMRGCGIDHVVLVPAIVD